MPESDRERSTRVTRLLQAGVILVLLASVAIARFDETLALGHQNKRANSGSSHEFISSEAEEAATDYVLSWWTVDGGGATFLENDGYTLGRTIGQPDAAVWDGSGYSLIGGFWGGALVEYAIYLPVVLRNF